MCISYLVQGFSLFFSSFRCVYWKWSSLCLKSIHIQGHSITCIAATTLLLFLLEIHLFQNADKLHLDVQCAWLSLNFEIWVRLSEYYPEWNLMISKFQWFHVLIPRYTSNVLQTSPSLAILWFETFLANDHFSSQLIFSAMKCTRNFLPHMLNASLFGWDVIASKCEKQKPTFQKTFEFPIKNIQSIRLSIFFQMLAHENAAKIENSADCN